MNRHKHIRLQGNDYTRGTYFVTLCTRPRREWFGRIVGTGTDAHMELNDAGHIVDECWHAIPDHFAHARLDQMQIMPDHLHAIIILSPVPSTQWVDPTRALNAPHAQPNGPKRGSLGAIIGSFKSITTKRIRAALDQPDATIWQRGYHERKIRQTGGEYGRIADYIRDNPAQWQ